jgi:hypothetical protein
LKTRIEQLPIVGTLLSTIYWKLYRKLKPFQNSKQYWIDRYEAGKNSGCGSYNQLAEFKAEVINNFIKKYYIRSIIEYGCGDGNQLKLADYPSYVGFDVSPRAISLCKQMFFQDKTKIFKLVDEYQGEKAQLSLSLDVIYHLIEDDVFNNYMERLFDSSTGFVIIYSSNTNVQYNVFAEHIKHRMFSTWIEQQRPLWKLFQYIPNSYPFSGDNTKGSFSDFYIYSRDLP